MFRDKKLELAAAGSNPAEALAKYQIPDTLKPGKNSEALVRQQSTELADGNGAGGLEVSEASIGTPSEALMRRESTEIAPPEMMNGLEIQDGEFIDLDAEQTAVTALVVKTSAEIAELPELGADERQALMVPEFQQAMVEEVSNASGFGQKLKKWAAPVLTTVGASIIARKVANTLLPGSGTAAGAAAGGVIAAIRAHRQEKARKAEVTEYLESSVGQPAIELAAKYVRLLGTIKEKPEDWAAQLELQNVAEQLKGTKLENVKGADLILLDIKRRDAVDAETVAAHPGNRKLLKQLEAQYTTRTDKAALAKKIAAGAALGALGSALGGVVGSYLGIGEAAAHAAEAKQVVTTVVKETVPDALPIQETVWGTAKAFLKSQGIETSNANVLKAMKHLVGTNDVDVTAWGEHGGAMKDIAMADGTQLKGFHEVLHAFGKEVPTITEQGVDAATEAQQAALAGGIPNRAKAALLLLAGVGAAALAFSKRGKHSSMQSLTQPGPGGARSGAAGGGSTTARGTANQSPVIGQPTAETRLRPPPPTAEKLLEAAPVDELAEEIHRGEVVFDDAPKANGPSVEAGSVDAGVVGSEALVRQGDAAIAARPTPDFWDGGSDTPTPPALAGIEPRQLGVGDLSSVDIAPPAKLKKPKNAVRLKQELKAKRRKKQKSRGRP